MNRQLLRRLSVPILLWAFLPSFLRASGWFALGPYGGDARSFAADPSDSRHLYLGTETGWLYESRDAGSTWVRVSRVGKSDDLVLDHILVDPKNPKRLLVGAWKIEHPDGGLFISDDGGKSWYEQAQMRGQSVRAMAQSLSDPREIVAGTLEGIYRSLDTGTHWELISPPGSTEIHEVQSLAIDPSNPQIIYAGTWHLPWKTVDGGANWRNIKQGIIEDSDVFSIIVDPRKPQIVYASACSGIYKSTDAAELFKKVQGIPSKARRTRKLLQDPAHSETVYAGTTEGLYRTLNGGETFDRMTTSDVVVNDVYVDPHSPNHVLIATERGGVLSSDDAGVSFRSSNTGFSARQVTSFASDARNPTTVYVGVVNDKTTGGVFQSLDGGIDWQQQSNGLGGRDVFSLVSMPNGTLLAGTGHGIFRLENGAWVDSGRLANVSAAAPVMPAPPKAVAVKRTPVSTGAIRKLKPAPRGRHSTTLHKAGATTKSAAAMRHNVHANARPPLVSPSPVTPVAQATADSAKPHALDAIVYGLAADGDEVFAGTSQGLLKGTGDVQDWSPVSSLHIPEARFVAAQGPLVLVAGLKRMALSVDDGASWDNVPMPAELTQIYAVAVDNAKNIWVGGTEGVFYSTDFGLSWNTLRNLYVTAVDGLYFDAANERVLVTSLNQTVAFAVHLPDYKVSFWDAGWTLRFVRPVGDHLIGATLFDGMVVEPRMVDSAMK